MKGILIVLGAPNDKEGNLSRIARERCDHAITVYKRHPGYKVLLTGGYGPHFNTTSLPHASYTKHYLMAHHVPEQDILEFVESSNTVEDVEFAKPIIEKYAIVRIIVITSDFHLERAKYLFCKAFPDLQLSFSGCHTNLPPKKLEDLGRHEQRALERLRASNDIL